MVAIFLLGRFKSYKAQITLSEHFESILPSLIPYDMVKKMWNIIYYCNEAKSSGFEQLCNVEQNVFKGAYCNLKIDKIENRWNWITLIKIKIKTFYTNYPTG